MQFTVTVPDKEARDLYDSPERAAEDIRDCLETGTDFSKVDVRPADEE